MTVRTAASVTKGDALPPRTLHIERATLVRYAGASLDFNPIHWDGDFAREVGLPDVIAHGMFTMGAAAAVATDWAGDAGRVVRYTTKFVGPVVVPREGGADVEFGGTVTAVDHATRRVTVELTATHEGAKVLGRALLVLQLD
ncbi:MAG: MaoC family dehydratase N-terminal domain-containing protein [Dermatophilaceae bacterium]|jgi:acyl dehydratase|nr:MaoC family dehydratase N-terminal domain-containing protein [Dermatophilaceae bacterium]MBP9917527.1 MaoC family dehydratase N-terminal domain-containing protein [Dermatophilaceae bacterium]